MEKQLPKNWVLLPFTEIFDINGGTQPPKAVFIDEPKEGYIRLLQIRDFGKKPVPTYIPDTGKLMTCKKDDILIARYGASIGRIVTGMDGSYNVALAKVSVPENMNKNFVKWLLKSNLFQEPILSIQRTAQNGFNKTDLAAIYVPLPPLPEQHRIVAKLDMLFAQLETIKNSMANIPLLLKDLRQQMLTQAVTGKLTEEWRKGKELDEWKKILLNDICDSITDGDHQAPPQVNEGIPFLVISNVSKGYFEFEKVSRFVSQEYYNSLKDTRKAKKGDILYTVTGSYGIPILVDFNKEFCFQRHIAILRPDNNKVYSNFIKILLQSDLIFTQARNVATGTAQLTVPLGGIKKFEVNLPTPKEQQEIVRRVESLFAKADTIEQQYKTLKVSIDTLPQAILHKAFKGELTEQLDTDGDARELLKAIAELKNIKVSKPKTYKVPKEKLRMVTEGL